jgi:hypothetical protein
MKFIATLGLVALAVLPAASAAAIGDAEGSRAGTSEASAFAAYDSGTIDLRVGWDSATACHTDGRTTQCFSTEKEMDAALGLSSTPLAASALRSGSSAALLACGSTLKLYTGTSYTGSVLALSIQFTFLNLSTYGFSNVTSSYKVGGCSSTFYDGSSGSGAVYPGNTSAWAQFPSMVTGWSDRVSSVYIG